VERLMKKTATDTAFACKTCVHSAVPAESAPCSACVYGIFDHQFNNHAEATNSPTNEGYVRRGQPSDGPEKLAAEKKEIEETTEHHAKEQKSLGKIIENAKRLKKLEDKEMPEKKAEFDDGENGTGKLQALGKVVKQQTKLGPKFKVKTAAATYVGSQTSCGTGRTDKKLLSKLTKKANMMMGYGGPTTPQMGTGRKIKMTKKAELFSKLAAGIPETPVTSNDEPGDMPLPAKKKLRAKLMKKTAAPVGSAITAGTNALAKLWGGRAKLTGKLTGTANLAGRFAKAHPVATAAGLGTAGLAGYGAMNLGRKLTY
jgi:hypothetical protein